MILSRTATLQLNTELDKIIEVAESEMAKKEHKQILVTSNSAFHLFRTCTTHVFIIVVLLLLLVLLLLVYSNPFEAVLHMNQTLE